MLNVPIQFWHMVKIKYYRSKLHCGSHPLSKKLVIFASSSLIYGDFQKVTGGTPIASSSRHGYDLVFFQAMVTTQFLSPQCFRNPKKLLVIGELPARLFRSISHFLPRRARLRQLLRTDFRPSVEVEACGSSEFGWDSFLKYLFIYNLYIIYTYNNIII